MKDFDYELPIGTVLDSGIRQYRITEVLGHGGFGITYKATAQVKVTVGNITTIVPVFFAIKEHFIRQLNMREGTMVLTPNASNADEVNNSLGAFLAEAERLNKLSLEHPGIVKVNEHFRANGTVYYVMEFVEGESLRQYVKRHADGCLPESEAVNIILQVGDSLSYLHTHGVTHLDVKPDNILLHEDGTAVLIDFGLAKHYDKKGKVTSTIKVLGTSDGYSPLEQYQGIDHFSPEADVYALAATLLFMLTGRDPKKSIEATPQIIGKQLEDISSDAVCFAIQRAMAMLPSQRTQSVDQFLRQLLKTSEIAAISTKATKVLPIKRQKKRFPHIKYSLAFIVALILGVFFVWWQIHSCTGRNGEGLPLTSAPSTDLAISYEEISEDSIEEKPTEHSIPSDFVLVPAGTLMKAVEYDHSNNRRSYDVDLDSFYICKYELTQQEYKRVMGKLETDNCLYITSLDYSSPQKKELREDSLPVLASYEDLVRYCNKRSALEGYDGFYDVDGDNISFKDSGNGYRLANPFEWIYAAKGGPANDNYKYAGSNNLGTVAWYGGNSGNRPHKVGQKAPNSLGLYDMTGNLSEIVKVTYKSWDGKIWDYESLGGDFLYYINYAIQDFGLGENHGTRIVLISRGMTSHNENLKYKYH